ncbi:MAG: hypothetical protein J07HX5_00235 [halophilic archaeon J07HX5]|nr:MAG: hypothetical protein J07HX5_00235 [halophilic archaeon J07HX5]
MINADNDDSSVPAEFILILVGLALSAGEFINLTESIGVGQAPLSTIGNFLIDTRVGIALFKLSQSTDKSPLSQILRKE